MARSCVSIDGNSSGSSRSSIARCFRISPLLLATAICPCSSQLIQFVVQSDAGQYEPTLEDLRVLADAGKYAPALDSLGARAVPLQAQSSAGQFGTTLEALRVFTSPLQAEAVGPAQKRPSLMRRQAAPEARTPSVMAAASAEDRKPSMKEQPALEALVKEHAVPRQGGEEGPDADFCENCGSKTRKQADEDEDDDEEEDIMEDRRCNAALVEHHPLKSSFLATHNLGQRCKDLAECVERVIGLFDSGPKQADSRARLATEVGKLAGLSGKALSGEGFKGGSEEMCEKLLQQAAQLSLPAGGELSNSSNV